MLNSSYGKTCEGLHDIEYKLMHKGPEFNKYIFRNYNVINHIDEIGDKYFI